MMQQPVCTGKFEKGGGFHYHRAEQMGKEIEIAVALGTDPALLIASVSALPEGFDEVMFASFLRGDRIPMTRGKNIGIQVPASAEFILEGVVPAKRAADGRAIRRSLRPLFQCRAISCFPPADRSRIERILSIRQPLSVFRRWKINIWEMRLSKFSALW